MNRASLRRWCSAPESAALVQANRHGTRTLLDAMVRLLPIVSLTFGLRPEARFALLVPVTVVMTALLYGLARLARAEADRSAWLMQGMVLVVNTGSAVLDGHFGTYVENDMLAFVVALVPVGFMAPRPLHGLLLGLQAGVVVGVGHAVAGTVAAPGHSGVAGMALGVGMIALFAGRRQRRVFARLADAHERLLAADRLAQIGRRAATIAHDLKTPLAAARNALAEQRALVDELRRSVGHPQITDDDLRAIASDLGRQVERADELVERTTRYVHGLRDRTRRLGEAGGVEDFGVTARIEAVVQMVGHRAKAAGLSVQVDVQPADLTLRGDAGQFDQVVTNLIDNAINACGEHGVGGCVRITARDDGAEGARLVVEDDGPGVPVELRETIFEPLFTRRPSGEGTGLGLSICRDLMRS
ncbi:MAG: HAMP domain-containing histidine kinase, partial [Myxococcales bacterium]|nr:HAMP domain-containing histidine kinase [Myxococcales bacterium]